VVLECLVVAAASSTDGRLVTASAYENAGNHGIVHKGLATGAWRHHIAGVCCPCKRCLTPPRVHREALAILQVHSHGCHAPIRQPIGIDGRGQFGPDVAPKPSPATIAGKEGRVQVPSRPPHDLRPSRSDQVSRARRTCCGPAQGALSAPSSSRMCPPAHRTAPYLAQADHASGADPKSNFDQTSS
jgi:hypothetical protein